MRTRGFTLIEMLVSVAVFSIVMVVALGALLALSEANRKAELFSEATNNLNSAIDSMTRTIRTGSNYHCGTGAVNQTQDCQSSSQDQFAFLPNGATLATQVVVYKRSSTGCPGDVAGCILRSQDGGVNFYSITSADVTITSLKFYVIGAPVGIQTFGSLNLSVQPKVVILISGYVTTKSGFKSNFKMQTSVTQRLYDQ
jgi:prepilin-type N-terminal cleavage/methylation domain-containing protein